jgi:hypothetical protein
MERFRDGAFPGWSVSGREYLGDGLFLERNGKECLITEQ